MVAIFRIISEYERALTRVKYPLNILQTYWKYTSKVYLKYTSTCWITEEEVYYKWFEAHFVKLNQYLLCKLELYFKYTLIILKVYFLEVYCQYILSILPVYLKYTFNILQLYFINILEVYFTKKSCTVFRVHLSQWTTLWI